MCFLVSDASLPVGLLAPRNLRVSDEWYTRFRVSWDAAPSKVKGYKLVYQPEGESFVMPDPFGIKLETRK